MASPPLPSSLTLPSNPSSSPCPNSSTSSCRSRTSRSILPSMSAMRRLMRIATTPPSESGGCGGSGRPTVPLLVTDDDSNEAEIAADSSRSSWLTPGACDCVLLRRVRDAVAAEDAPLLAPPRRDFACPLVPARARGSGAGGNSKSSISSSTSIPRAPPPAASETPTTAAAAAAAAAEPFAFRRLGCFAPKCKIPTLLASTAVSASF